MRTAAGGLLVILLALPGSGRADDLPSVTLLLDGKSDGQIKREKLEQADTAAPVTVQGDMPDYGHSAQFQNAMYNIWSVNCHTESNYFTALATSRGIPAGILVCQGNPESDARFHTASWAIDRSGNTCIYNYGESCCWSASASPPNIAAGRGQACAQAACGNQYNMSQTRAMRAGQLVESPGPHVCAVSAAGGPITLLPGKAVTAMTEHLSTGAETVLVPPYPSLPNGAVLTFTPERRAACLECCDSRASLWSNATGSSPSPAMAKGREDQFRRNCLSACNQSFAASTAINQ